MCIERHVYSCRRKKILLFTYFLRLYLLLYNRLCCIFGCLLRFFSLISKYKWKYFFLNTNEGGLLLVNDCENIYFLSVNYLDLYSCLWHIHWSFLQGKFRFCFGFVLFFSNECSVCSWSFALKASNRFGRFLGASGQVYLCFYNWIYFSFYCLRLCLLVSLQHIETRLIES